LKMKTNLAYICASNRGTQPPCQRSSRKFVTNLYNGYHQRNQPVFHHQQRMSPTGADTPHFHGIPDRLIFFADCREKAKNHRHGDDDFFCDVHTLHSADKLADGSRGDQPCTSHDARRKPCHNGCNCHHNERKQAA